ncbi:MAG: ISL3 family transposase [Myxococcales bacterium]|nr:ISL3 family transposase [Myxococcales bacterium]
MHVKTLLNFVEKHKGFVYERVRLERDPEAPRLLVTIRAAKRSKPCCSVCGARGPTHSHLAPRVWQGVPLWGITVLYLYAMRRVACRTCERVIVEAVPWSRGKHTITTSFALFLARWAKRMSWKQVAHAFGVSWQAVYAGVTMAVEYGLAHRTLDDVEALGVDEVMWRRGTFLTVVYALDEGRRRLLWIGRGRSKEVLRGFFDWFGDHAHTLRFVATDMWQAYMAVIKERAPQALNVLDRFHISANLNKAVDAVRSQEARALAKQGKDVLKHKRWLLLKAPENLSEEQAATLAELVKINLKTFRAYLLKEELRQLWGHASLTFAAAFLYTWCRRAVASRITPVARFAKTIEKHADLILNWFRAAGSINSGAVEGLNNKLKITLRRSYGFRSYEITCIALYHAMGDLPESPIPRRFCSVV